MINNCNDIIKAIIKTKLLRNVIEPYYIFSKISMMEDYEHYRLNQIKILGIIKDSIIIDYERNK